MQCTAMLCYAMLCWMMWYPDFNKIGFAGCNGYRRRPEFMEMLALDAGSRFASAEGEVQDVSSISTIVCEDRMD